MVYTLDMTGIYWSLMFFFFYYHPLLEKRSICFIENHPNICFDWAIFNNYSNLSDGKMGHE